MQQTQVTRGPGAARRRRRLEREPILPLDPRDPDIVRARQLRAASRFQDSGSEGTDPAPSHSSLDAE